MLEAIDQIKRHLAKHHNLPYENGRVVGNVPDGNHIIDIGNPPKPHTVTILADKIWIGDPVAGFPPAERSDDIRTWTDQEIEEYADRHDTANQL